VHGEPRETWSVPVIFHVVALSSEDMFACDTVTLQNFCTTQKIIYLPQVLETSYHINMIIYKYSIYIFDMNMRSGSHALLHVGKSEKMRF